MNDAGPVLVDVTASLRRQARQEAAKVLVTAGWSLDQIALALGISLSAAVRLMPKGWRLS